jgi:hypothetical protein
MLVMVVIGPFRGSTRHAGRSGGADGQVPFSWSQAAEQRKRPARGPCCRSRDGGRRVADAVVTTADPRFAEQFLKMTVEEPGRHER